MVVLVQMKEHRWEIESAALTPPQPLCLFLLILPKKIFYAFCDVVSMRFVDLLEQLSLVICLNIFSFSNRGHVENGLYVFSHRILYVLSRKTWR